MCRAGVSCEFARPDKVEALRDVPQGSEDEDNNCGQEHTELSSNTIRTVLGGDGRLSLGEGSEKRDLRETKDKHATHCTSECD